MKTIKHFLAIILIMIVVCATGCGSNTDKPANQASANKVAETTEKEEIIDNNGVSDECSHKFSNWSTTREASCTSDGVQSHTCNNCGYTETQTMPAFGHVVVVDRAVKATCETSGLTEGKHCSVCNETIVTQEIVAALGHTEVIDNAVAATCTTSGVTEGKHCSVCNDIFVVQDIVAALGHTVVIDEAVGATCTTTGLTEGKHCSICNETLVAQETVEKAAHNYIIETVVQNPTCITNGVKKFTCDSCTAYITQEYELPKYTGTQIYDQALEYVGEIIVYDRQGSELGLATGFVYSSDGKIITNYHVIDGAYSAKITINGKEYTIAQVLAYDKNIDLAVLKVNATFTNYAKICKNPITVGSAVYAIGSSRGMTNTFSQGIVTYYDRVVDGVSHIQHDASITNGNSGGPLINEYGEVVGINSWLLTNSQNLNFAVFTKELDNLVFGTPMTMAQFYQNECDLFTKIVNYIMENGNYNYSSNYYYLVLGTSYSSDYTDEYTRVAYYYVDDNEVTLDFYINSQEYYVYFYLDPDIDGSYTWYYFDKYDNEMRGTLYASTYTSNTLLGYSYNNIYSSSMRNSVRELASAMMSSLCSWITSDFSDIGVTADDLHFYNY